MMQMAGAFAEYERAMLRERTKPGLDFRPSGRTHRRAPARNSRQQQAEIRRIVSRGDKTAADAARLSPRPPSVGSFVKPFSFFCSPFPRIRVLAIQVLPGNSRCLYSEEFPGRWEF
jgi:hypothetical protein